MSAPVVLVLDSVSPAGARLTTFELTMSVHCLGQITKHRMLSINAESARAVPTATAIEQVMRDPWFPRTWPSNGKGMQPSGTLEDDRSVQAVEQTWLAAARSAARRAATLTRLGVHKEIANRLLSPFRKIKVVVSGTGGAWPHFFALRCAPDAQEEIRDLAEAMKDLMMGSPQAERKRHLPYITQGDRLAHHEADPMEFMLASAYRCARVSYGRTGASGLTLAEEATKGQGLATSKHWSALEHVCTAFPNELGKVRPLETRSGNMTGWRQLRKDLGG